MTVNHQWYVLRTHFGKEFSAKKALDKRVADESFVNIKEVVVPVYKEIVYKDGKKREVERKSFPGYIYVNMALDIEKKEEDGKRESELTDDGKRTMSFVKEVPYISGFVYQQGALPRALSSTEVKNMTINSAEDNMEMIIPLQIDFDIGQKVLVIDGPFNNFSGTIKEIYPDKEKGLR